jgi:serine/threonine-protein kinase HipA
VLGNGDAHLKNFSLIKEENIGYHLSPAYDIVNSRLVLPDEREEMCLSLQGKKNRFLRKDFIKLAEHFGLNKKQFANSLARLNDIKPVFENMIEGSFLNERLMNRFLGIYRKRMERFFG